EAEARRELGTEAELDAELRDVRTGRIGRHALTLRAHAEVHRQLVVDGPGVLREQADVRGADVAFGDQTLTRGDGVAAHRVVAVGTAVAGQRLVPEDRDALARFAVEHVV